MHVVITGASSGIGEALAREYARAGAHVTLVARRRELLDKLAATLGTKTFVCPTDLTSPDRAVELVDAAEAALGPIDVLINNAGVQHVSAALDLSVETYEALFALNVLTPIRLMRRVLPGMLARNHGAIVNLASVASWTTVPGMSYYAASKAGISAFSETLRAELRGTGVHVLTVHPGPVQTPMADAAMVEYEQATLARLQPIGTADVLAARIRRSVEKRRARLVYPRFYHLPRVFPNLTRWITDRFAPRPRPRQLPAAAKAP